MTRLPRLLDANLAEVRRLHPTAATVTLNLTGVSEGSLTLPDGATIPPMHSFVELYTDRGSAGIFRVTNVSQTFLGETELTLRHARDTFSDSLWEAQEDFEGTVAEYLARAASFQSRWTVGTVECAETVKRTMNYDRLNGLLDGLESDYPDFCFTYDTTVSPWVLNFVQKPADVACEFRIRRNMVGCTVTLDDSDLCNIVTVSANHQKTAKNGTVSTDTVYRTYTNADAVARWGAIHRPADIDVEEDVKAGEHAETDAWAARFLAERADPTVQIDVDGLALAALTGDAWDEPALGQLARVSVPEYDAFFAERVVSITWPDLLEDPRSIRLSLANVLPSFSESLAKVQSAATKAGKAAKRAATTAKEATSWSMIVSDIDETVSGVGLKEYYESGIIIDARDGVKIYTLQEGMQALNAVLNVNKTGVSSLVAASGAQLNADGSLVVDEDGKPVYTAGQGLYSLFEQTASDISAEATRAQLAEGGIRTSLSGYLTIEAGRAQLGALLKEGDTVVSRANLFAMINDDGSSTGGIQADKIILSGSGGSTVTLGDKVDVLGDMSVNQGNIYLNGNLYCGLQGDKYIQATTLKLVGSSGSQYANVIELGASDVAPLKTTAVINATLDTATNTLTLTKADGTVINFSKAAGVTVDSITAPILGAGDTATSITATATASNGNTKTANLALTSGSFTPTGASSTNRCVDLRLDGSLVGRVNVQPVYNAGASSVTVDSITAPILGAGDTATSITATATASNGKTKTANLALTSTSYTPSGGSSTRCVNLSLGGNLVGRISVQPVYTAGFNAGQSASNVRVLAHQGYGTEHEPYYNYTQKRIYYTPYVQFQDLSSVTSSVERYLDASDAYDDGYNVGYNDGIEDAGGGTNRAVTRVQLSPIYDSTGHSVGTTFVFRYSDGTNTSFKSSGMAVTTTYTCTGNLS